MRAINFDPNKIKRELADAQTTEAESPTLVVTRAASMFPDPIKLASLVDEATERANGTIYNSDTKLERADWVASASVPK
ncbi:hypothetical protein OGAPHI_007020 [Ogataea philodendri]|uniref:Uncharacterized protein n=1 Tax=Ogataea philodendri TaxID=1378263 RepID=A0A9P8NWN6_9ASCO|nr:uncharacterized protein OGAPHI_007020 [Ogataea philodendri]KAH3660434.1 hypothetical protein OGAPHI_007020 [Ogataea philodendri]